MTRKLIVNADDYGRTREVSRGILRAHQHGIVTSTTVMINRPSIEAQLEEALDCPELGVGQHLVFSTGRPVLSPETVPGLVDERGDFLDQHSLWANAGEVPIDQLHAELAAQIERFAILAGRLPDHFDCHHFVHIYPPFFEVYVGLAAQYNRPLRVPFPIQTDLQKAVRTLDYLEGFPPGLVRAMVAANSQVVQAMDLSYPIHFASSFFGGEALNREHLFHLFETLPEGISELMCHPGLDSPALSDSGYRMERQAELTLLTDPTVRQHLQDLEIELVTFSALAAKKHGDPN
jgi:predicted glycoside hydrolase/deacetylase ChbG (UPF0249 family)